MRWRSLVPLQSSRSSPRKGCLDRPGIGDLVRFLTSARSSCSRAVRPYQKHARRYPSFLGRYRSHIRYSRHCSRSDGGQFGCRTYDTGARGKKWSDEIKIRLARWVRTEALEVIESAFSSVKTPGRIKIDDDTILIEYEPQATGTGYSAPTIKLEFGARSTGEPWEHRKIACDAAQYVPQLRFPSARPQVMQIERTLWEKATAMHVFCVQGRFRGAERFARHWHDVARMDETGHAAQAVSNEDIRHRR